MLALTFSTGIIDAVGYLGLDRVFTGNMTGNVVLLGMGLMGESHVSVVGAIIALALFVIGATIGGRVLRRSRSGWTARTTGLFAVVAVILLAAASGMIVFVDTGAESVALVTTGALGAAMGMQAAAARWVGVKDVTTVVVTSTLVGLSAESVLGSGGGQPWLRRLLAVVLIGLGALLGAATIPAHPCIGVFSSCAITIVVAVLGHRMLRED